MAFNPDRDSGKLHPLFDSNNLLDYHLETFKRGKWKNEPQHYNLRFLHNNLKLRRELMSGEHRTSKGSEFLKSERGRTRHIRGRTHRDRIVRNILCEQILTPNLERFLIHNNGASIKGKGLSFSRRMFERDLHNHYLQYGDNVGFIAFFDFSKYFDNIPHDLAKAQIYPYIDPISISVLDEIFDTFRVDVSYLMPEQLDEFMDSVFNSVEYFNSIPKEQRKGLLFAEKSIDIGDRISQNIGVLFASRVDYWVKNVCRIKRYGRYNDDGYLICRTREEALRVLEGVYKVADSLHIHINRNKTRICKLSGKYKYLQIRYSLTETGRVIRRVTPKALVREKRKLKAYRRLLDKCILTLEQIKMAYKSWLGNYRRIMSKRQLSGMNDLFFSLFGEYVRWKK